MNQFSGPADMEIFIHFSRGNILHLKTLLHIFFFTFLNILTLHCVLVFFPVGGGEYLSLYPNISVCYQLWCNYIKKQRSHLLRLSCTLGPDTAGKYANSLVGKNLGNYKFLPQLNRILLGITIGFNYRAGSHKNTR